MESIKYVNYAPYMGVLINIDDEELVEIKYDKKIYYEKLLYDYPKYLNKNTKYYFICKKGKKSKRLVSILRVHGYDATQVIK